MGDELGPSGSVVSRPAFEPCNRAFATPHAPVSEAADTAQGHHAPGQRTLPVASAGLMGWKGVAAAKRFIF